jgi:translation initiation factor IF-3
MGVMPLERALALAREADLDLVEVNPNDDPPVCRILDYGKFKYEMQKKQRAQAHHAKVKEIHLRPGTGKHDLEVKVRRAREFLEDRDKVLVVVQFKGREAAHIEEGMRVVQEVIGALSDVAKVENPPKHEGKQRIVCLLGPKPKEKAEAPVSPRPQSATRPPSVGGAIVEPVQAAGKVSVEERPG